ncbi:MAG: FmdB family zinc ribbon protein [Vicinamibacteria bacterium]
MPLYEYECPKDGAFEQMQKFSDPPLAACPKCGGPVEKLLSAPAIQFKGSGWYVTDYARKGSSDSGGSKKSESKESGSTSASKSDSGSSSTSSSGGGDKK